MAVSNDKISSILHIKHLISRPSDLKTETQTQALVLCPAAGFQLPCCKRGYFQEYILLIFFLHADAIAYELDAQFPCSSAYCVNGAFDIDEVTEKNGFDLT